MTRASRVERTTTETKVIVEVDLDGTGRGTIETGVGMFDHLLTAFAHHSLIDIVVSTQGDLEIDDHHTVEDTMLVLGSAIDDALGDREGIARYGNAVVPMDEALATAAIDLGGRPYATLNIPLRADRIGELSTQLIDHAIESFARTARTTVNITTTGRNDHHVAEATFKALARATRMAVELDPRRQGVPSTKGIL